MRACASRSPRPPRTAGSAVVFAGMTVVIALVGLTVVNIPFLTVMGLAAAGTVTIAVLIAITLLPALLGFAGSRVARVNRVLGFAPAAQGTPRESMGTRWVALRHLAPAAGVLVSLAVLGAVALPALHMKLGLPDGGSKPTASTERRAYDLLTEGFGPGFNGTLTVVVDAPRPRAQEQKAFGQQARRRPRGASPASPPSRPPSRTRPATSTIVAGHARPPSPASDETKDLVTALRDKADEHPRADRHPAPT